LDEKANMATETLPNLMKAFAVSVRRAADRPEGGALLPEDFEALVRYCLFCYREARRAYRVAKAMLRQGVEAGDFLRRCNSYLESVSEAAEAAARVRQLAPQTTAEEANATPLATLTRVEKGLAHIQAAFAIYLGVLDQIRSRPIDRELIERRARETAAAGDFVRIERFEDLFGRPPGA
jgi:hypothetical protein